MPRNSEAPTGGIEIEISGRSPKESNRSRVMGDVKSDKELQNLFGIFRRSDTGVEQDLQRPERDNTAFVSAVNGAAQFIRGERESGEVSTDEVENAVKDYLSIWGFSALEIKKLFRPATNYVKKILSHK